MSWRDDIEHLRVTGHDAQGVQIFPDPEVIERLSAIMEYVELHAPDVVPHVWIGSDVGGSARIGIHNDFGRVVEIDVSEFNDDEMNVAMRGIHSSSGTRDFDGFLVTYQSVTPIEDNIVASTPQQILPLLQWACAPMTDEERALIRQDQAAA